MDSTLGPHTIDLMALPSNVKLDRSGRPFKFFSLFPCVQAQGTNVFSQVLSSSKNAFVFPPLTLIGPLLKFLASQPCPFKMIPLDVSPRQYWLPLLCVRLRLHSNWTKRGITQFFHSLLNQAILCRNSDHFNCVLLSSTNPSSPFFRFSLIV